MGVSADGSVVELEIPARREYVALARMIVSAVANAEGRLADDRVDDLKIAVSEACTNAIEAHDALSTNERVIVRSHSTEGALEVVIIDRGKGFDPANVSEPPPVGDPRRLEFERGLGIPLIRRLVDEVEFDSSDAGTAVRLVMHHDDHLPPS